MGPERLDKGGLVAVWLRGPGDEDAFHLRRRCVDFMDPLRGIADTDGASRWRPFHYYFALGGGFFGSGVFGRHHGKCLDPILGLELKSLQRGAQQIMRTLMEWP